MVYIHKTSQFYFNLYQLVSAIPGILGLGDHFPERFLKM